MEISNPEIGCLAGVHDDMYGHGLTKTSLVLRKRSLWNAERSVSDVRIPSAVISAS